MRDIFSGTERLKTLAQNNLENWIVRLKYWWVGKYNLPPNHPLLLDLTLAELALDWYNDRYMTRAAIQARLEIATSHEEESSLRTRLNDINVSLGEAEEVEDELIDKWERELAEGKMPNLSER